jgi:hypothetical protein
MLRLSAIQDLCAIVELGIAVDARHASDVDWLRQCGPNEAARPRVDCAHPDVERVLARARGVDEDAVASSAAFSQRCNDDDLTLEVYRR